MTNGSEVTVRRLAEADLDEADRIMRQAFGTFLGLPDPMAFMGDADYVRGRWTADPTVALAAELDGRLVGTNFVTRWGSVGFFGPLTVEPGLWDRGIARRLLDETMAIFDRWGVSHAGLFTFGHSPKHIALYQSYGFMPRFLTSVLARPPAAPETVSAGAGDWAPFSTVAHPEETIVACGELTGAIYPGLDVAREIRAAEAQKLGDTVLVYEGDLLAALAVCHTGPGSEAGTGAVLVKFGAALPGTAAPERFGRLLNACEAYALRREAGVVVAGVNMARRGAYQALLDRGYRAQLLGVALHRPDESAYHDEAAWVIDDWR